MSELLATFTSMFVYLVIFLKTLLCALAFHPCNAEFYLSMPLAKDDSRSTNIPYVCQVVLVC